MCLTFIFLFFFPSSDSTYKRDHAMFFFLCLAISLNTKALQDHSFCCTWQDLVLKCWIIVPSYVCIGPHFLFHSSVHSTLGVFHILSLLAVDRSCKLVIIVYEIFNRLLPPSPVTLHPHNSNPIQLQRKEGRPDWCWGHTLRDFHFAFSVSG